MKHICIGITAHVDAGKTTLSEAMLYQAGALKKLGRVDHQDAFLDTFALERARGITIFSKQAEFSLPHTEVTLLDTPGHVDFSAEMERTLQEKRDAEHFLKVLAPKYKTVIVVDLQEDTVRPVIVPDYFQSVLDTCGGSFRAALTNYRDTLVAPEDRDGFAKLLDFGLVRSTVFSSNLLEHRYRKTDGRSFCIRVTPYSRSGSHINEVLWIFADEEVE